MTLPDTKVKSETPEHIADGIAADLGYQGGMDNQAALAEAILSALRNERERCARIVNDARGENYDLRSLVSAIREGR